MRLWQLELAKYVPEFERKAAQITANKERFAQVRAFCIRRGLGVSIMEVFGGAGWGRQALDAGRGCARQ